MFDTRVLRGCEIQEAQPEDQGLTEKSPRHPGSHPQHADKEDFSAGTTEGARRVHDPANGSTTQLRNSQAISQAEAARFHLCAKSCVSCVFKLTAQAGRRTLVGFGDWSNQYIGGIIKKCPSGPVKPLERMHLQYYRVESFDVFSQLTCLERKSCTSAATRLSVTNTPSSCVATVSRERLRFTVYSIARAMAVTV